MSVGSTETKVLEEVDNCFSSYNPYIFVETGRWLIVLIIDFTLTMNNYIQQKSWLVVVILFW